MYSAREQISKNTKCSYSIEQVKTILKLIKPIIEKSKVEEVKEAKAEKEEIKEKTAVETEKKIEKAEETKPEKETKETEKKGKEETVKAEEKKDITKKEAETEKEIKSQETKKETKRDNKENRNNGNRDNRNGGNRDDRDNRNGGNRDDRDNRNGGNRDDRDNRNGGNRDNRNGNRDNRNGGNRDNRNGNRDNRNSGNRDNRNGNRDNRNGGNRDNRNGNRDNRNGGNRDNRNGNRDNRNGGNRDNRNRNGNGGGFSRGPAMPMDSMKSEVKQSRQQRANKDSRSAKQRHGRERDRDMDDEEMFTQGRKKKKDPNRKGAFIKPEPIAKPQEPEDGIRTITLPEKMTIKELSDIMKVTPSTVIKNLFMRGQVVTLNHEITFEEAEEIALEYNCIAEMEEKVDKIAEILKEDEEDESKMKKRPPVVCVMGHVDHGKTSLLDAIRETDVTEHEAGGITQHIGAYNVKLSDGRTITFLDTPGHEAFTAMRARGAQVTDIAIIIVAADDNVMPQTIEAINHASAAGVPIVFAINKIDKPGANPDKIREELANMNYLVEEWGGKYQCQEIAAKKGLNIEELLEKVLLEAELLDMKANPHKKATGSIIESSLDKGRGYVATVLVQSGTLKVGDIVLAGQYFGHVKAMFNERGEKMEKAGPSEPALILGLNGAPQAGDKFNVMGNEKEARQLANKREQLQREQGLPTQKHITLDEIGRRIAIGNFQELNVIVKGDVDGSIEALSDSLIKLSTEQVQVNVIHKGVGAISESDVSLAAASDAIIIGFQVRPSNAAAKMAENEGVDIRKYSVIYDAIEEVKAAMEGMLAPELKEQITATIEIREVFNITKVGLVAGAVVKTGKVKRSDKARLIRDGIVIFTGNINALKRFKDDVKEVGTNFECGISLVNCNDMKVGDMIETFEEIEVKQTL